MAFAYDSYTNPSKNNGVLRATLTAQGVGSLIDKVAARVSFTVETTVLPSFARQRASLLGRVDLRLDPFFSLEAAFLRELLWRL